MKLLKEKCTRPGYEDYTDFYLTWTHEGKDYKVRVRPVFGKDNALLHAVAETVLVG